MSASELRDAGIESAINDPVLKSISARVRLAAIKIRQGKPDEALAILSQCEAVLPIPSKSNWRAAHCAAKRAN